MKAKIGRSIRTYQPGGFWKGHACVNGIAQGLIEGQDTPDECPIEQMCQVLRISTS